MPTFLIRITSFAPYNGFSFIPDDIVVDKDIFADMDLGDLDLDELEGLDDA